ncbi:MAG: tRNA (adenosine(37)-N6)-threonylcarbamoyltransferase complex dimerization subunit type 1 TsaB [Akkermansiaceae bacterium]
MILAIETSVSEASVTLVKADKILFSLDFINGRNHNSQIFDALEGVTKALAGRALDLVIVGTGPGSYSGVRVGIASAQGLAIVHDCPTVGLGSLAATPIARGQSTSGQETSIAVGDARRGLYYISQITESGEATEPELMELATFRQALEEAITKGVTVSTLDDFSQVEGLADLSVQIILTKPESSLLIDLWLGLSPARRAELSSQPLAPAYLRDPFTSKAKAGHPLLRGKS